MKKLLLLFLVAILGGPLAMNALADSTTMNATPDINKVVPVDQVYNDQTLIGTLTALDRDTGQLTVSNTVQGAVAMQFDPSEVWDLKLGDTVVIHLGFGVDQRSISAESCEAIPAGIATC
ncbi:MAG: hypothetical protein KGZ83_21765 [Sulfuricella sp.]|nr:hypothetical protein [Sulfuricella sp.]